MYLKFIKNIEIIKVEIILSMIEKIEKNHLIMEIEIIKGQEQERILEIEIIIIDSGIIINI
jgi:hypothetical protein